MILKKYVSIFGITFINLSSIVAFFIAFDNAQKAILYSIPICFICFVVIIISLSAEVRNLNKEVISKENAIYEAEKYIKELENNKKTNDKQINALVIQNKNQRMKIQQIHEQWNGLNIVFSNAIQSSKKERFEDAYKLYLLQTNYLFNDNKEDL